MGGKIIWILILVVVLGFVVFIFRFDVPEKLGSFSGSFRLGAPDVTLLENYGPKVPVPTYRQNSSGDSGAAGTGETVKPKPIKLPEGFVEEQISPYYGMVNISSVRAGSLTSRGHVRLSASFSSSALLGTGGGTRINISGWMLRAERGSQIVPRAVNVYDPLGLAVEEDVLLASAEYLTIYTNSSAIGINFRLNKCTGYLENNHNFSPALPMSCPNPVYDFNMASVTGACENYIRSLSSCRLPGASPPVPNTDYACREYLDRINMKGCYDRHRGDPDFLSREWRAWTGRVFLDSRHDTIHLLDREGLLVDVYSY